MKKIFITISALSILAASLLSACRPAATAPASTPPSAAALKVLAAQSFLADIAQNVAGERARVETLIPLGVDPHTFQPTPRDVARIAESRVLVVNGAGFERWLQETVENAGGQLIVIEASTGLAGRTARPGEPVDPDEDHAVDPHFWFDPVLVERYVENIRDGLIQADPQGKDEYTRNAQNYLTQLKTLDGWIRAQVEQIPAGRRLLVTDHESFGYFADRYGFRVVGAILPSLSSEASPSARQLADLIDQVRDNGVKAIFIESSSSAALADQVAAETGARVIGGLFTHSLTPPGGEAPTYIDMMKYNTRVIVEALK